MKKLKLFLATLLPGIFLVGFNIGTGSITVMAKAGAKYGMDLAWAVGASCYITYFMINIYGKFTLVTGETALSAFRKYIHPAVGLFFIIALTVNVSGSIIGVMGIISNVCYEWSKNYYPEGILPIYFAIAFTAFVYCLFLLGKTRTFEKAMGIIVCIMSLCFIINFVMLLPSLDFVVQKIVPNIPGNLESSANKSSLLITASMVGTTVFSGLFIVRTILVREIGWKIKDIRIQRRDAMFSAFMMFVIAISIMGSAAIVLNSNGVDLIHPVQMLSLLEPVAGHSAAIIFGIGIIAAGISSQFPNVILLPMLLSDYYNTALNMKARPTRIIVLLLSLLGLIVPLFEAEPILVMVASQAFGAVLLPFTVACILYLGNKRNLMKSYAFNKMSNVTVSLILIFALYMSFNSITGLLGLLDS